MGIIVLRISKIETNINKNRNRIFLLYKEYKYNLSIEYKMSTDELYTICNSLKSQFESHNKEIGILRERLNRQAMAIKDLVNYVNVLETVLIHPVKCMSPTDVSYENDLLTFKVDNARLVEFVDIRINEDKWVQFWSRWSNREQPFDLDADTNTIRINLVNDVEIKSLEIFTRYDKFTNSSDAGRTLFEL